MVGGQLIRTCTSVAPDARTIFTILRLVVPRTIESSIRTTRLPSSTLRTGFSLILTPKERIDWLGDLSAKGLRESAGIMVNYLYRLEDIEKNHEAYANQGEIAASSAVKKLLKTEGRRLLDMRLS